MPVDTILKKSNKARWTDEGIKLLVDMGACVFHCGNRPDIVTLPGVTPWKKTRIAAALGHEDFIYLTKNA